MRTFTKFSFLILATVSMFCASRHKESADTEKWTELDSFHSIMADVYHPLKDSGNLQPALQRIEELANEAEKWASAPLPKRVDRAETKDKLEKLKVDTRALADAIKTGAAESEVAKGLTEIHELFHGIMEAWEGEEHDEAHHDKH